MAIIWAIIIGFIVGIVAKFLTPGRDAGGFIMPLRIASALCFERMLTSVNARQIIQSLISGIPFVGSFVAYSILGSSGSFQLIYVHHIATATIFLVVVIMEHARTLWIQKSTFLKCLALLALASYFFRRHCTTMFFQALRAPGILQACRKCHTGFLAANNLDHFFASLS